MKRVIKTLNEMSFDLPDNYEIIEERYKLENGQGFIHRENYVSNEGKVISLFEIHREPEEFLESYLSLTERYKEVTDFYELEKQFSLKVNDFNFPVFVIKGFHDKLIYVIQIFVNCGDRLGCFMINIENFNSDVKSLIKENSLLSDLVKILRTIE